MREVKGTISFIGEARQRPVRVGQRLSLRVQNGKWQTGFRFIAPKSATQVYVATEDEFTQAAKEGRQPRGDVWPVDQMSVID